jgi:uncharacterized protein
MQPSSRHCLPIEHRIKTKLALLAMLFAMPLLSSAASFNCANAKSYAEKSVCADPLLSKLDDVLSTNYRRMLAANTGASPGALKQEQRKWQHERDKCSNQDCLVQAYARRIDETCEYGVVEGVHPICQGSDEVVPKGVPPKKVH